MWVNEYLFVPWGLTQKKSDGGAMVVVPQGNRNIGGGGSLGTLEHQNPVTIEKETSGVLGVGMDESYIVGHTSIW